MGSRQNSGCINSGNPYHRCSPYCSNRIKNAAAARGFTPNEVDDDFPPLQRNDRRKEKVVNPPAPLRVAKTGREAWSSLFTVGRSIEQDSKCSYIPPKEVSSGMVVPWIPKEAISANTAKWDRTLAGYVVGDKPFYSHLRACVHRLWRPKGKLQVHSRENGFFFFVFELEEDCSRVLQGGPWMFDKRVIVLRRWTPELTMDRDLLSSIPVWVRLPDLPLKFWSTECISIIASSVGKPMFVDKATASGERYSYARCFVEIEATKKLPKSIEIAVEDEPNAIIKIEYENLPPRCYTCECFGHSPEQCTFKKVWVEKSAPDADGVTNLSSATEKGKVDEYSGPGETCSDHIEEANTGVPSATVIGNFGHMDAEGNDRVDNPDNVENDDEEDEDGYENEWMEEMEEDATMANYAYEEEMRLLAATSKYPKKKQREPSPQRKSSRLHRKNRKYFP